MAPITIKVAIPNQKEVEIALQRFADNIDDWRPYWNDYLLPLWFRSMDTHFATQGASTGGRWPALSDRYRRWKERHWPGLPTLVLSGALRESLTVRNDPNAIVDATKDSLTIGTRVSYAGYHQSGTRKMPARPPVRITREFVLEAGKLLQEFGWQAAKKAGVGE